MFPHRLHLATSPEMKTLQNNQTKTIFNTTILKMKVFILFLRYSATYDLQEKNDSFRVNLIR